VIVAAIAVRLSCALPRCEHVRCVPPAPATDIVRWGTGVLRPDGGTDRDTTYTLFLCSPHADETQRAIDEDA
jgi:hypothetical protein